ncbi:MAG: hypothetical protein OXC11_03070, partial [Rhodospirillales bacterium]|nr:hypothetical protein [Rhodospirillales bacterium]
DPRSPFDEIRSRIKRLNPKRVRLSCRELDWLGENDRTNLSKVVPGGEILVLRLEPLNADEQRRIVEAQSEIPDAEAFLAEAAERGVGALLSNPQTLVLLIRAVGEGGEFPAGRTETFERACIVLAGEPNEEHRSAGPLPPADELLDAAGRMCAVSLLSGSAGLALPTAPVADGFVPISALGDTTGDEIHAARTRLFVGAGDRRFAPAHANIAAFLAARHAARLVDGPVPGGRVLALLSGNDGFPPTPLRSLVAWLAVTSPSLRKALITHDPVAVLMYGDVRDFNPEEKAFLLDEIARNPSRLHEGMWPASAIEGLVSPDMEPALRSLLGDPDRSDAKQTIVRVIAAALQNAPSPKGLTDDLLAVVVDASRNESVRIAALDAWLRRISEDPCRDTHIRDVLHGVRDGGIEDQGGELLGTLLGALYPRVLTPPELWEFFDLPSARLIGRFFGFWHGLPDNCPEDHLPAHLDYLSQSKRSAPTDLDLPRPDGLPVRFLARGLETHGEGIEGSRLTAWLRVGLDESGLLQPQGMEWEETSGRIRNWLVAHPERQKAAIHAALRTSEFRKLESVEYLLSELLYRSSLPGDIGSWHLDQAAQAEDDHLAERHVWGFLEALGRRPERVDEALAVARRRLTDRPDALKVLESGLKSCLRPGHLAQRAKWQHLRTRPSATDTQLIEVVRAEIQHLSENRGSPNLLRYLAQKRYETTREGSALPEALGNETRLVEVTIAAIRKAPERKDLPSAEQVAQLRRTKRESPLLWPVLVGLADTQPDEVLRFDDARLRTLLAFLLVSGGLAKDAAWYQRCVRHRPELVAEVLILIGRVLLAAGEDTFGDAYRLADDEEHLGVAQRTTLPLLRAFPARATNSQLAVLDALLRSGLRHLVGDRERAAFRELVARKARQTSTTRIARVHWLAAGLGLGPDGFLEELSRELQGSDTRLRSLESFVEPLVLGHHWFLKLLKPAALAFLIRTFGKSNDPVGGEMVIKSDIGVSLVVPVLVTRLSQSTEESAGQAVLDLIADNGLARWRTALEVARDSQRVLRRDAMHAPPPPDRIIAALRDGPPASPADLRELVLDRLGRIGEEMRTTNANPWRQFWTEDKRRNRPKDESACRDSLFAMLVPLLPGCDAQPEGQYASNRRADIRVASGDWNIPIEIKKNSHKNLWRAARRQLLPGYTNDPATQGLGIYLVLWFGPQHTAPVPEGPRPETPDALRDRLLANLTSEERRRAAVVVIDVTAP